MAEFRIRSRRLPEKYNGDLRITLRGPQQGLQARVLRDVYERGQWEVFDAIRSGMLTTTQLVALVDEHGLRHYREHIDFDAPVDSLDSALPAFLAQVPTLATRSVYERHLNRLATMVGGGTPLNQITRTRLSTLLVELGEAGMADTSRRVFKGAVGALFSWWLERELDAARVAGRDPVVFPNPAKGALKIPVRPRVRFLKRHEYDALLACCHPDMRAHYAACVFLGLRRGELFNLRTRDIKFPSHVEIRPHDGWGPKGWPRYQGGVRDIPIHELELLPILRNWVQRAALGDLLFHDGGKPWTPDRWAKQIRKDCEATGLPYGRDKEGGITGHTFRHTLASWLVQADVQLMKVAKILGDTTATVEAHYAHLLPSDLHTSMAKL